MYHILSLGRIGIIVEAHLMPLCIQRKRRRRLDMRQCPAVIRTLAERNVVLCARRRRRLPRVYEPQLCVVKLLPYPLLGRPSGFSAVSDVVNHVVQLINKAMAQFAREFFPAQLGVRGWKLGLRRDLRARRINVLK